MREVMKKFRENKLPTMRQITIGEEDALLVHRDGRARFYHWNNCRIIVNADSDEEAEQILEREMNYIKGSENEGKKVLRGS